MTPTFDERADWFDRHYTTTRGRVRAALVLERLADTLPPPPATVLDVGGGSGAIAVPLATDGYGLTLLDPSTAMLDLAGRHAIDAGVELRLVQGGVEMVAELAPGPFDAICCHAVLLYLDDPGAHLATLRRVVAAGATLSLLEKNRLALAMRPGLRGDYAEAIRVLDDPVATGNLGIENRSRSVDEWTELLEQTGWRLDSWVGDSALLRPRARRPRPRRVRAAPHTRAGGRTPRALPVGGAPRAPQRDGRLSGPGAVGPPRRPHPGHAQDNGSGVALAAPFSRVSPSLASIAARIEYWLYWPASTRADTCGPTTTV